MPRQSVHVRLQGEQLDALDRFRRRQPDLPSKPEALRRALQQAARQAETGRERPCVLQPTKKPGNQPTE